jgi:hypothetical protein
MTAVCARCSLPIGPGTVHVTYRGGLPAVVEHTACARPVVPDTAAHLGGQLRNGSPPKPKRDWLAAERLP